MNNEKTNKQNSTDNIQGYQITTSTNQLRNRHRPTTDTTSTTIISPPWRRTYNRINRHNRAKLNYLSNPHNQHNRHKPTCRRVL